MASTAPARDTAGSIADQDGPRASIPMFATPFKLPGMDSYPGGKGSDGTIHKLINAIPPHHHYVEPFVGGGAVVRHKRPAPLSNTVLDLDKNVIQVWLDQAPPWVQVVHGDGLAMLGKPLPQYATGRTFWFIDPPYLDETLKSGQAPYAHRFTYEQHVHLLRTVEHMRRTSDHLMMVCALPNLLYERHLKHWNTFQYQNMTRVGLQTEQVWFNYTVTDLHDYRYLGKDYRDRERIKRKQKNKIKELAALPPLERKALLEHIRNVYP
jgi:hypothetical protein